MTPCETTREMLSAMIDGELSHQDQEQVLTHLEQCQACDEQWHLLREVDEQLNSALSLDDLEDRAVDIVTASQATDNASLIPNHTGSNKTAASDTPMITPQVESLSWWMLGTIAATLLLTFTFLKYFQQEAADVPSPSDSPTRSVAARLVASTGPVDILSQGEQTWRTVVPPETIDIPDGSRIRTATSAVCEIQTNSQGKVRLDKECEIVVNDSQKFQLVCGQLWCSASEKQPLEVEVPIKTAPLMPIPVYTCPEKTSFQCASFPNAASCTPELSETPTPPAHAKWGDETRQVSPGQTIVIDKARQMTLGPRAETTGSWQLPLLVLSASSPTELKQVIAKLLAPIGRTKAQHANEQQIRALGLAGVLPLLSLVEEEQNPQNQPLRRNAMRLAIAAADRTVLPMLQSLTNDRDPVIASQAIETIKRIQTSDNQTSEKSSQ